MLSSSSYLNSRTFFIFFNRFILQICEGIQNEDWEVIDPNPGSHGPYAHNKDGLWVGYDDEEIAREKVIVN